MQNDPSYFRQRAVQITADPIAGGLPPEERLRSLLGEFGEIWHLQLFSQKGKGGFMRPPQTAVVVFRSNAAASRTMGASRAGKGGFGGVDSIKAHGLEKGVAYETFWTDIVPRLRQESFVPSSGSNDPPGSSVNQLEPSNSANGEPSLKRPRTEGSTGPNAANNHASLDHRSSNLNAPGSVQWMPMRIAQLERELNTTVVARDVALSGRFSAQYAHQAEEKAHQETLAQKCAAEAALSREKAESAKSSERVKTLERELQETRVRLEEQQRARETATAELNDGRQIIRQLQSNLERSKVDLTSTAEQLAFTKRSLELMEREHALTIKDYESAKERLEIYKQRLESEQTLALKLKDTLIPGVYRSLGATQESLNALMSAIGLPPTSKSDNHPFK
ncbi:unnamed protein product [Rhizoctonia solani]|uniref:RRM domain-containing protein n=1 Tax=Rhizoctonia solani TaxID=456999 RepID=A0A8H3DWP7_9AGAM|nr:unnamed protein product [Rhizoctonia solani]